MVILDEELGLSDEERLERLERGADDLELHLTALLDHFGGTEDDGHGRERPRRDHRTMLRRAWDAAHLRSVGCKLSEPVAARFKRLCDDAGLTRYEVLRRCVMDLLQRHGY